MNYTLRYTNFDRMENRFSDALTPTEVTFWAENDDIARHMATSLWDEARAKSYEGWDNRMYPREPWLYRKIDWTGQPVGTGSRDR